MPPPRETKSPDAETLPLAKKFGARRLDRLEEVASEVGGEAIALDVADTASVERFVTEVEACDVLVNNAGGALGLDPLHEADEEQWRQMYESTCSGRCG